jgi:hypothetical protein
MKYYIMSQAVDNLPKEIHIVPIGEWRERGFRITEQDCEDIVKNFARFGIKLVIDYEHQSLNSVDNGEPAPAAGWINKLEKKDNGIWATDIEWTEEAKGYIETKRYRYISPVILFDEHDPHSDEWIGTCLHSVALTNTPYFKDDLEPMINKNKIEESNKKAQKSGKENKMTLEEQVIALQKEKEMLAAKIAELEAEIAKKDAKIAEEEQIRMVEDAITGKKLLPSQREVGLIIAKEGKETFEKFVAANVIPDLTTGKPIPEEENKTENPQEEYRKLLNDPEKLEAFKKNQPEQFNALRNKALYGGK